MGSPLARKENPPKASRGARRVILLVVAQPEDHVRPASPSIPLHASGTNPCRAPEHACSGRRSARRKFPTSWSSPSSRTEARRAGGSSRICAYAGEVRRRSRILRPAGRRAGIPSARPPIAADVDHASMVAASGAKSGTLNVDSVARPPTPEPSLASLA